jgi:hypothetical protein
MSNEESMEAEEDELVRDWLASVDRVKPEEYTTLASFDDAPAQARADSYYWSDCFFSPEASPHLPGADVGHQIHQATEDTWDLLRHEYAVGGIRLLVIESRNFTLIQVQEPSAEEILSRSEPERGAEILRIASVLLNMSGHDGDLDSTPPTFQLPSTISGECAFSTNCDADPHLIPFWGDRIDAGIHCDHIFFLCYKRISQIVGFFNAQQWFEADSRPA